jgi:beta-lactamase superfamily II metal-dependent hydrolase
LRTDRSGWITILTDGEKMRVETERGQSVTPTP